MRRFRGAFRQGWTVLAWWTSLVLAGVVVGAAATSYLVNRQHPASEPTPESVTVRSGTLSRTLRLPAHADWPAAGAVHAPAGGIVTAMVAEEGLMTPGQIALRIDERPVILVSGEVPAFRPLTVGTKGRDVQALKTFLATEGYSVDSRTDDYTATTATAVSQWQADVGFPNTGEVALGDVVFIEASAFDAPMRWGEAVEVGAPLTPGAILLSDWLPHPSSRPPSGDLCHRSWS